MSTDVFLVSVRKSFVHDGLLSCTLPLKLVIRNLFRMLDKLFSKLAFAISVDLLSFFYTS